MPIKYMFERLRVLPIEEVANTLTHGFGLVLSILGFVVMTAVAVLNGGVLLIASAVIYGLSLIALYGASTIYHGATSPGIKEKLQLLDHCCIFLLIAGTHTPFSLLVIRGSLGNWMLAVVWIIAVAGIIAKILLHDRVKAASVLVYLVMGWIGVLGVKPIFEALGLLPLVLLVAGGVAYSAGTIFYGWESLKHHHAIWHLFVLLGSIFHFAAVILYVFPFAGNS